MGKITPRFFLAVFIFGLCLLSANTVLANITYGPEKPLFEKQVKDKSFFVGFLLEDEISIKAPDDIPDASTDSGKCYASGLNLGAPDVQETSNTAEPFVNGSVITPSSYRFDIGTTQVIWKVTDENGDTFQDTQNVTVKDEEDPEISLGSDILRNTDTGKCTAAINIPNVSFNDNCSGESLSWSLRGATSGSGNGQVGTKTFNIGITTITYTVTDAAGNDTTESMEVEVEDNEAPSLSPASDITRDTDAGNCTASMAIPNATFDDNCSGESLSWSMSGVTSGNGNGQVGTKTFNIGITTITYTVTDAAGNDTTKSLEVEVEDNEPPSLSPASDITRDTDAGNCIASIAIPNATFDDNCSGESLSWRVTGATSGSGNGQVGTKTFNIGITTITYTVTDAAGNDTIESIEIEVEDNEAPIKPTLPNIEDWSCGKEITDFPTTTDNCSGVIIGTTDDDLVFDSPDTYIITWSFTDEAGITTTAEQKVIIPEPTVDTPKIENNVAGGMSFCNTEVVKFDKFTGNTLQNKHYEWFYTDSYDNNIDIGLPASGTGDIPEFIAKNNTSEPITAVFTVIPLGNDCQGDSVEFSITINPTPSITIPNDIEICEGETINTIDLSNFSVDGSSVEWTNDNTNIGLNDNGTGNIASFTAANGTNQAQIATISLIPSANNCVGETQTFTIEVKPKPQFEIPEIPELCNGAPTQAIPLTANFSGITYDITGGSSIGLSNKSGVTEIPSFTPVNNSDVSVNATIKITPKAKGCIGEVIEVPITVKPSPVVDASFTNQICSDETTDISLSSPVSNTGFTWTVDAPAGIEGASDSTSPDDQIIQQLINTSSEAQVLTYKVTPITNGCEGATIPIKITVNPKPVFEISLTEECSTSVDLTDPSIKNRTDLNYTYWSNPEGTNALTNPSEVGMGTYYVKAKNSEGCESETLAVEVSKIIPQLTSELATLEVCSGESFQYTFESNIPVEEFYWSRQETDGIDGIASGEGDIVDEIINNSNELITVQYQIFLEAENGCSTQEDNPYVLEILVRPTPKLSGEKVFEACSGQAFKADNSLSTSNSTISWQMLPKQGISASNTSGTGAVNTVLTNNTNEIIERVEYVYSFSYADCDPITESIFVDVKPAPFVEAGVSMSNQTQADAVKEIEICAPSSPADINSINLYSSSSFNQESATPLTLEFDFENGIGGWNSSGSTWNNTSDGTNAYENCYWVFIFRICNDVTFNSPSGNNFALLDGRNDNTNSTFISPNINTVGQSNVTLTFDHYFRNLTGEGYIEYTTDGSTWLPIEENQSFNDREGSPGDFRSSKEYILPSGYENLQFRFRYDGGGDYRDYWAIDNIEISSDSALSADVLWTRSDDPDWKRNLQNLTPDEIGSISETTTFTATYSYNVTDDDVCSEGSDTVKVIVREPLQPQIVADYCFYEGVEGKENTIILSVEGVENIVNYEWRGQGITDDDINNGNTSGNSIEVDLASTYYVTVTDSFGCTGEASLPISKNLVQNGTFEEGNSERDLSPSRTDHVYFRNYTDGLYEEGTYLVGDNANRYHSAFTNSEDHTPGAGNDNYLIINSDDKDVNTLIWEQTIDNIKPNTDYYFRAYGMNLVYRRDKEGNPELQFYISTDGGVSFEQVGLEVSFFDEATQRGYPAGQWLPIYNIRAWNSGDATSIILRIDNNNDEPDGNDFGIDDISFAELQSTNLNFELSDNGPICQGNTIELYSEITEGGRLPITFDWTGPDGFNHSTTVTNQEDLAAADTLSIPNATPEMAGEYSLQITDFYGCNLESKTTTVEVIQKAVVDAGENMEICSNEPVIDLSEASITHSTINTGFWTTINGDNSRFTNPNSINTTYNPNEDEINSGEIELILTSDQDTEAICESVSDTINIIFNISPVLELVPEDVACFEGNNGQIKVSIAENTGTSPFSYQWSNGETGSVAENLVAGDYYVDVTDASSCTVRSDTITIRQPEKLLVGNPVELEEASCFDEFGTVVTIPVSGGLFAEDTIDVDNLPYQLDILNSEGNSVSLSEDQITYNITDEQFIISGLQGGKAYTFLVSSSENCSAEVETFTTLTPPEINAGETPEISECGVKTIWLAASPVDPEIATGSWSYNNGETELLGDPNQANTSFTGEPGEFYTFTWTVTSIANPECAVPAEPITIDFPNACNQLNFDGDDDFVDLGNHFGMEGSSFAIEAWVKPNDLSGTRTIFSKREEENLNSGYDLILNNGAPTFRVGNQSVVSANKLSTNRWYHIAGVYTGSEMKLYVDGIQIQTNSNISPNHNVNNNALAIIGAAYASSASGSKNNFSGYIEELRIWNTAIPVNQIRFFMNQRLEKEDSNVSGTVLGNNLNLPNAPEKISWSKLLGYYQLLAEVDLTSDGFTTNLGSIGTQANGLLKNIQDMQENTAPMPYKSINGEEWHNRSSWDSNSAKFWTFPNDQGINGEDINWNIAIQKNDLNSNNKAIKLLGLISETGTQLIMNGTNNSSGNELRITHYLELNGHIDLNGESQLVQTEGSILAGNGTIEKQQTGTASSYNYNYWSTPVLPNNMTSKFTVAGILKKGLAQNATVKDIKFGDRHDYVEKYGEPNKINISNYWINGFFPNHNEQNANQYHSWKQLGSNPTKEDFKLLPGEGFTMKGTKDISVIEAEREGIYQTYIFNGFPNNGTLELRKSYPNQNYLIGNPYPSAVDANRFIDHNEPYINGAIYYWHHFAGESHYLAEYIGGYATYTKALGLPAKSIDSRIDNSDPNMSGGKRPGRFIPVAQGFFVNTSKNSDGPNSNPETGVIEFTNSMRVFAPDTDITGNSDETQFLKPETKTKEQAKYEKDTRYKIRLNFNSPQGYWRQIGVAADGNTTQGIDYGYEALLIDKGTEDMYWMIEEGRFVIQGVPHFNLDQRLPLGITIAEEKEFSIEIGELENVPDIIDIYLRDNNDSTHYDLRKEAFKASLPAGEYQDLYEIVFHDVISTRKDKEPGEGPIDYYYSLDNRKFVISNPELHKIEHINIYNIAGQLVDQHFGIPDLKEIHVPQKKSLSSAVYIVKVYTDSGDYAKKVIIRKD